MAERHNTIKSRLLSRFRKQSPFANCLVPLLDTLGWVGNQGQLAEAQSYMASQMDLPELRNTMAILKFESHSLYPSLESLDPRLVPCLFINDQGLPIVLIDKIDDKYLTFDGNTKKYTHIEDLHQVGEVVIFRSTGSEKVEFLRPQKGWFFKVASRFRTLFFLGLIITLVLTAFTFIAPLFVQTIYNQLAVIDDPESMHMMVVGIFIFLFGDFGFRALRGWLFGFISVRLGNMVGIEVLRRILYLPPSYTEEASLSSQISHLKDFETIREFIAGTSFVAMVELPYLVLLIVGLILLAGPVAYIPIVAIAAFALFAVLIGPVTAKSNAAASATVGIRQDMLLDMLSNFSTIKTTGCAAAWAKRHRELSGQACISTFKAARLNSLFSTITNTLVTFASLATMTVGVIEVLSGDMSIGALIASMLLLGRILSPMKSGLGSINQVGRLKKSIFQLDRLMAMQIENRIESNMSLTKKIQGKISFVNCSIRYSSDAPPALLGVNFSVNFGETLVVVGHNGSGKSTVLSLIMSHYQPQAGRVLIDDMNLRQIDPITLRKSIGFVPKSNKLFHGTLTQNCRLANPAASDQDVWDAAKRALIYDQIMDLPEGFNTFVNSRSIRDLSLKLGKGISLARVFLKQSNIILLDTPEFGLSGDPEKVENFIAEIKGFQQRSTTIIATQNKEFCQLADKVLWLERGRVRLFGPAAKVLEQYFEQTSQ